MPSSSFATRATYIKLFLHALLQPTLIFDHVKITTHQYQKLGEQKQKLVREVERLRTHLLTVEEGYTHEALEAEEREKDLRTRLAAAEERVLSASTSVQNAK